MSTIIVVLWSVSMLQMPSQKCKNKLIKPTMERRLTTSSKYGFFRGGVKVCAAIKARWQSNSGCISGSKYVIETDGLLVRGVERADAGTYTCRLKSLITFLLCAWWYFLISCDALWFFQGKSSTDRGAWGERHQAGRAWTSLLAGTGNSSKQGFREHLLKK